ncbi:hypothetical protein EJV47_06990 [Hymenobacter gummosus]|uniref:Uncharacterized protein n=1 Tax=Hymenobacter gummosus TaxID=1776032 RepID=A0A431U682_9BACT|nr:DUF6756 family protein [Hymenobacter gummosus]RTQ51537.1 hypothetical protein EJV47_06990 [Hymenobacter gummosus]
MMWTDIRREIERVRQELGLTPEQFRPLGLTEWPAVEKRMRLTFGETGGPIAQRAWLWEQYPVKQPTAELAYDYTQPAAQVAELICGTASCFVFVDDVRNERQKLWWYQGSATAILALLDEIRCTRIGLLDKHFEWMLYLDHHDAILGYGAPMVERMQQLPARRQQSR